MTKLKTTTQTTAKNERVELLEEQDKLFGRQIMLPEICLNLRMAVNGSADPWPDDQIEKTVYILQRRLDLWIDSHSRYKRVDDAVKELVIATLAEVKNAK